MDLHTMCLNCDRQAYSRAAAFEADLDLIASNCHDFNTKHNVPEPAPRADRARPRRAWQGARRRAPRGHPIAAIEAQLERDALAPPLARRPKRPHTSRSSRGAGYASLAALPSSSAAGSSSSAFDAASSAFDGDDASSVADSSALDASSVGGGSDGEGGYAVDAAPEAGSSLFDQSSSPRARRVRLWRESEVSDGGASEVKELTASRLERLQRAASETRPARVWVVACSVPETRKRLSVSLESKN